MYCTTFLIHCSRIEMILHDWKSISQAVINEINIYYYTCKTYNNIFILKHSIEANLHVHTSVHTRVCSPSNIAQKKNLKKL